MSKICSECNKSRIYYSLVGTEEEQILLCTHYDVDVIDETTAEECPLFVRIFYLPEDDKDD